MDERGVMDRLTGKPRYVAVGDAAREIEDWRYVHNEIIPTDPLSSEQVAERATRYRLEMMYLGGQAVGCSTVRPATEDEPAVTVIARILPEHRRRGLGTALYRRGLDLAREFAAVGGAAGTEADEAGTATGTEAVGPGTATGSGTAIETVVLASNESGLRFAEHVGFVEVERYLLDGDTVPYVALRLRESRHA